MASEREAWMVDDGLPTKRYVVTGPVRPGNASEVLMDTGLPEIGSKWKVGEIELPLVCCELRVKPARKDGSFWEVIAVYRPTSDES